jgi:hypothetical protein
MRGEILPPPLALVDHGIELACFEGRPLTQLIEHFGVLKRHVLERAKSTA